MYFIPPIQSTTICERHNNNIISGYISVTFFKILALTTIFGLFHGLVLLPVILSIMGPTNYSLPQTTEESKNVELEPRERNH